MGSIVTRVCVCIPYGRTGMYKMWAKILIFFYLSLVACLSRVFRPSPPPPPCVTLTSPSVDARKQPTATKLCGWLRIALRRRASLRGNIDDLKINLDNQILIWNAIGAVLAYHTPGRLVASEHLLLHKCTYPLAVETHVLLGRAHFPRSVRQLSTLIIRSFPPNTVRTR